MREVRDIAASSESVQGVSPSISVKAAARQAKVSPSTVRRALVRDDLRGIRVGPRGQFRIPEEALGEWIRPAAERS